MGQIVLWRCGGSGRGLGRGCRRRRVTGRGRRRRRGRAALLGQRGAADGRRARRGQSGGDGYGAHAGNHRHESSPLLLHCRGTLLAVAVNIGMKFALVWGAHLGAVGIALGTSLGTWANVSVLFWLGRRRGVLHIESHLTRALPVILLAACATGAAALGGVLLAEQVGLRKELVLAAAVIAGGLAYGIVTLLFRSRLPLGRYAQ